MPVPDDLDVERLPVDDDLQGRCAGIGDFDVIGLALDGYIKGWHGNTFLRTARRGRVIDVVTRDRRLPRPRRLPRSAARAPGCSSPTTARCGRARTPARPAPRTGAAARSTAARPPRSRPPAPRSSVSSAAASSAAWASASVGLVQHHAQLGRRRLLCPRTRFVSSRVRPHSSASAANTSPMPDRGDDQPLASSWRYGCITTSLVLNGTLMSPDWQIELDASVHQFMCPTRLTPACSRASSAGCWRPSSAGFRAR